MFQNEGAQIRPELLHAPITPYTGDSGITAAIEDEYFEISFAVEGASCKLDTGKPCQSF
jgi:hypothetical protein